MLDFGDLYTFVFGAGSAFLIVESVYGILGEMRRKDGTTLSQATVWIRSLLMIVLAIVMMVLIKSSATTSV